jgi:hypothetical protein
MTGTNQSGFPFLFALCTLASLVIWFGVDVEKGRRDAVRFATERRASGAATVHRAVNDAGGAIHSPRSEVEEDAKIVKP